MSSNDHDSAAVSPASPPLAVGQPFNPWRMFHGAHVPEPLLCSSLVPSGAKLCYAQLARHAGENGLCYPKQATLGAALGVSDRQVRTYLRQLERAGLLRTNRRGLNRPNVYEFLWHPVFFAANSLIPQDRKSTSALDRNNASVLDRKSPAGPLKEEESPVREKTENRSIEVGAPEPLPRPRRAHRHAPIEQWPSQDVEVIRRHLAGIPCQDGSTIQPSDELVSRLLAACTLYMRTSYELGALLYRIERRIQNRPRWWPEHAGSAAAWLLAILDREYAPSFLSQRKPPASAEPEPKTAQAVNYAEMPSNPDPAIQTLIEELAKRKALPRK